MVVFARILKCIDDTRIYMDSINVYCHIIGMHKREHDDADVQIYLARSIS